MTKEQKYIDAIKNCIDVIRKNGLQPSTTLIEEYERLSNSCLSCGIGFRSDPDHRCGSCGRLV